MFDQRTIHGAYFALGAYLFWGVIPVYFKLIDHVSPWEILSHRIVWSVVLLLCILFYSKQLDALKVELRVILQLVATASLLSINWLVFIYAIVNSNIVETSLGYFINPIVTTVVFTIVGIR